MSAPANGLRFGFKTVWFFLPAAVFLGLMPCYHLFEVWGWVGGWDGLAWLSAGAMAGAVCIVATVLAVILAVINHWKR